MPDGPGLVAYGPIIDIVLHNAAVKSSGLGLTKRMRVLEFETARVKGQADTLSIAGKTMGKTGTAMAGAAAGAGAGGALGKAAVGKSGARDAAGREQEQVGSSRTLSSLTRMHTHTLTVPPLPRYHRRLPAQDPRLTPVMHLLTIVRKSLRRFLVTMDDLHEAWAVMLRVFHQVRTGSPRPRCLRRRRAEGTP